MRSIYILLFIFLLTPEVGITATTITNDVTLQANTGNKESNGASITTGEATAEIYIETDIGDGKPPEIIHTVKENKGEVIIYATTTMETASEQTILKTIAEDGSVESLLMNENENKVNVTEASTATSTLASTSEEKVISKDSSYGEKTIISYVTIFMKWLASTIQSLFSWS